MLMLQKLAKMILLMGGVILIPFLIVHVGFESSHAGFYEIATQYRGFLTGLMHGDLGISSVTHQPIISELKARWPATIELGLSAFLISMIIGIPAGILAAIHQGTSIDKSLIGSALISYSIPSFWLALMLILFFSVWLDLTPVSGRLDIMYDVQPVTGFMLIDTLLKPCLQQYQLHAFYSAIGHMILPLIVLASVPTALFARMTRASLIDILDKDYILSARARGLSECRVVLIHALRNALPPVITVGGLQFISTVITGSIVAEWIFSWPGIGNYILQSIYARDLNVITIFLLSMGGIVLVVNVLVDAIQQWICVKKC